MHHAHAMTGCEIQSNCVLDKMEQEYTQTMINVYKLRRLTASVNIMGKMFYEKR